MPKLIIWITEYIKVTIQKKARATNTIKLDSWNSVNIAIAPIEEININKYAITLAPYVGGFLSL